MMTGTLDGAAKMNGSGHARLRSLGGRYRLRPGEHSQRQNAQFETRQQSAKLGANGNVGPANGDPSSFSSLSADFMIAHARLSSNKITLVGNGIDVDGSGSMTMAGEGSLDYRAMPVLLRSGSNPLATILGGLAGAKLPTAR